MTATIPAHADVRDCRLYRFRVYHPDDMRLPAEQRRVVLGYVGETLRLPLARLLEHVFDQPWADTIVGWDLDPRIFAGKAAVLAAERAAIEDEKPLYNVEWNTTNGGRVPPPLAIRQRRARDAAKAGAPRWVHPDDRGGPTRISARPAARPTSKPWRPWQKHMLGLGVAWAAVTITGLVSLAVYGQITGTRILGVVGAAYLLVVWVWAGSPFTWKRARRAWKRILRRMR